MRCCGGDSADGPEAPCPSTSYEATEYYRAEVSVTTSGTFFGTGPNGGFGAWAGYCGDYSSGCGPMAFRWKVPGWYGPPCGAAPTVCTVMATPSNVVTQASGTSWMERGPSTGTIGAASYAVEIEAMNPCVQLRCDATQAFRAFSEVLITYRWSQAADFKLGCYPGPQDSVESPVASHQWYCSYVRGQTGARWMAVGTYWLRRVVWLSSNPTRGVLSTGGMCAAGAGDVCRQSQWQPSPNKSVDTLWLPPDFIVVNRYV